MHQKMHFVDYWLKRAKYSLDDWYNIAVKSQEVVWQFIADLTTFKILKYSCKTKKLIIYTKI